MKKITAPTEDFIKIEVSKIASDVSAGSNVTITLESNDGFADNDFLVIGYEGQEGAELQQINAAVSGATDVQVATLSKAHKKGEPVTLYRYNKRKIYGATTKTGTYTELTAYGSPVAIQPDDPNGALLEYTGSEGYLYFKATYYNTETTSETDIDDAPFALTEDTNRYTSIYNIRKKCGFVDNYNIDDVYIETKRKQAESEINSAIFARYSLPLSEVPALIQNVCELLAAGYIDYEEFREDGEGKKWLGEARGILKALMKGTQRLIDEDGNELTTKSDAVRMRGIPNDDTEETADFAIDDEF